MMVRRTSQHHAVNFRGRCGFSLAEVAISVLLTGGLMVAALQSLGAAKQREADTLNRLIAQQLVGGLMNEILLQAYKEPEMDQAPMFGLEPGESTGNRSLFDDVDDYAGWTSSPPKDRSGAEIAGYTGWTRNVNVVWANPATLSDTASINTGLKKFTITATKNGQILASIVGYRSIGWVDTIPTPSDSTGNHAPVAVATSPDLTREVGQTVEYFGNTSTDQDGDYLSYVWNFGDGTTATGASVVKVYNAPGNFTCTLTVYDGHGGVGTSSLTAVIIP
jgi:Tfp pilus assembly protein PilV